MLSYHDWIYLIHFLFIGPLLIYVGYYKERAPPQILNIVLALGVIVTVYHGYEFVKTLNFNSNVKVV
jgi:hypothetical protein